MRRKVSAQVDRWSMTQKIAFKSSTAAAAEEIVVDVTTPSNAVETVR
jgi:hypothetical protein